MALLAYWGLGDYTADGGTASDSVGGFDGVYHATNRLVCSVSTSITAPNSMLVSGQPRADSGSWFQGEPEAPGSWSPGASYPEAGMRADISGAGLSAASDDWTVQCCFYPYDATTIGARYNASYDGAGNPVGSTKIRCGLMGWRRFNGGPNFDGVYVFIPRTADTGGTDDYLHLYTGSGGNLVGTAQTVDTGIIIPKGEWSLLTLSHSASEGKVRLYLGTDLIAESTETYSGSLDHLRFNALNLNSAISGSWGPFHGAVDEARLYDTVEVPTLSSEGSSVVVSASFGIDGTST